MEKELNDQEEGTWINIFSFAPSFNCLNYEPRFNGVFSRNSLSKIKDRVYVINLDDKKSKGTHWVSLFIDGITAGYFDSFGIEYIAQEVLNKIKDQTINSLQI